MEFPILLLPLPSTAKMGPGARVAALVAILTAGVIAANSYEPLNLQATSLVRSICLFVYVFCVATALGVGNWQTFISGIIAYKTLPRHTFGLLQSKIFPAYFQILTITTSVALALFTGLSPKGKASVFQQWVLSITWLSILANLVFIEPAVTKVMFERHRLEKEAGDPLPESVKESPEHRSLSKRFGRLHGLSALANLLSLGGLHIHAWFLATQLKL